MKLAINNRNDKKHKHRDNRHGNYPIRSHPTSRRQHIRVLLTYAHDIRE